MASGQSPVCTSLCFGETGTGESLGTALLRNYGNAIDQELGAGDHDFVSGLDAVEHDVIIAHDLADLQRFLADNVSTFLIGFGDKSKINPTDSRHGDDRNHGFLLASPNHA